MWVSGVCHRITHHWVKECTLPITAATTIHQLKSKPHKLHFRLAAFFVGFPELDNLQTGSDTTLHEIGLVQKVSQGDVAQEQGTMDSVTYDMILAAVERFLLRTFPRGQLNG